MYRTDGRNVGIVKAIHGVFFCASVLFSSLLFSSLVYHARLVVRPQDIDRKYLNIVSCFPTYASIALFPSLPPPSTSHPQHTHHHLPLHKIYRCCRDQNHQLISLFQTPQAPRAQDSTEAGFQQSSLSLLTFVNPISDDFSRKH